MTIAVVTVHHALILVNTQTAKATPTPPGRHHTRPLSGSTSQRGSGQTRVIRDAGAPVYPLRGLLADRVADGGSPSARSMFSCPTGLARCSSARCARSRAGRGPWRRFPAARLSTMRCMAATPKAKPRGPWTPEEIARNERVNRGREARDQRKTPEERLEETLRLSRFVSELRDGAPDDVRAR